jgi:5-methylcytosine-specific restriction protein B
MTWDAASLLDALRRHSNILLYGPPASGKTHLMQEVARRFLDEQGEDQTETLAVDTTAEEEPFTTMAAPKVMVRWVTFHQSYSYEDFILGLRPKVGAAGPMALRPVAGVLLELAAHALKGGEALLLIDEVNRGNASRIFGEFITLLERDKRLGDAGVPTDTTVHVQLPYLQPGQNLDVPLGNGVQVSLPGRFAMPMGVYTLASMNSVDRSIAPLDVALRRRFHLIELRSTTEDLASAAGLSDPAMEDPGIDDADHYRLLAVRLMGHLNRGIALYLGHDVELGAWYLSPLRDCSTAEEARQALSTMWWFSLFPQLEEMFQGQSEQLVQLLALTASTPVRVVEPTAEERRTGGLAFLRRSDSSQGATLSFLRRLLGLDVSGAESGEAAEEADFAEDGPQEAESQ